MLVGFIDDIIAVILHPLPKLAVNNLEGNILIFTEVRYHGCPWEVLQDLV